MKAFGEWVILESEETKTDSGIITNKSQCLKVVGIGQECPASIKDALLGKDVVYRDNASAYPIENYIVVHWKDILYRRD
tara:strand:- start:298 stop:534 length:237 start_codon:yes stop_codon:yes gene_type:complete